VAQAALGRGQQQKRSAPAGGPCALLARKAPPGDERLQSGDKPALLSIREARDQQREVEQFARQDRRRRWHGGSSGGSGGTLFEPFAGRVGTLKIGRAHV